MNVCTLDLTVTTYALFVSNKIKSLVLNSPLHKSNSYQNNFVTVTDSRSRTVHRTAMPISSSTESALCDDFSILFECRGGKWAEKNTKMKHSDIVAQFIDTNGETTNWRKIFGRIIDIILFPGEQSLAFHGR